MAKLNPYCLAAVVDEGLCFLSDQKELVVELEFSHEEKLELINRLAKEIPQAKGVTALDEIVNELYRNGFLVDTCESVPGGPSSLMDALVQLWSSGKLPLQVMTAEELLIVPREIGREEWRNVIRAFISGIAPVQRLRAYAYAVTYEVASVRGDAPDGMSVRHAQQCLESLEPNLVHVLGIHSADVYSCPPQEVFRGWEDPGRLKPTLEAWPVNHPALRKVGVSVFMAESACPNLTFAKHHEDAYGMGVDASPKKARVKALAESVERFVSAVPTENRLLRSREVDLPDQAVSGDQIIRFSRRQYKQIPYLVPYDSDTEHLWVCGNTITGERRWVPAELVFYPFRDPLRDGTIGSANSSGHAAHTDPGIAIEKACCEVTERDAVMWTWIQRVSRERIVPESLPDQVRGWLRMLNSAGYRTEFINLTLDTLPVVMCAVHNENSLSLGAACNADPSSAAIKALEEAACVLWDPEILKRGGMQEREVVTPLDHQRIYTESPLVQDASFLYSSETRIHLSEIDTPEVKVSSVLVDAGYEPVIVDLDRSTTGSLGVVAAIIPGLVPMSFGWDLEPLGLPRLCKPVTLGSGWVVGSELRLENRLPLTPHPFA